MKQKKGTASDVLLIAAFLGALGIAFFISYYVVLEATDQIINTTVVNESVPAVTAFQSVYTTADRIDYFILAFFIGSLLAMIITSYYVGSNPIFMMIYFIIVLISVVVSMIFSNTWESISEASIFGTTITAFPITDHLLTFLPWYIAGVGFIGIITMFAKPYFAAGGGR